jgi:succinate dehydrogenase / fumarate reductase, membrane anchor subunit
MSATIADPRSPFSAPRRRGPNLEKWGWVYMRASGLVLVVLIFGHLFVNLMTGDGIHQIDFAFVAGKLSSPFWQWWDVAMLWLALIHGGNGMRTITNDYVTNPTANRLLKGAILVAVVLLIILGTLVITTFDPCPPNAAPGTLDVSLCQALGK